MSDGPEYEIDTTTCGSWGDALRVDYWVHVEAPAERALRVSNALADMAMAWITGEPGQVLNADPLLEACDELARLATMLEWLELAAYHPEVRPLAADV